MNKKRKDYSEELESEYRRMERIHKKVLEDFNGTTFSKSGPAMLDSFFEFCQVSYHLREWVSKDSKVDQRVKSKLPSFIDSGLKPGDSTIGLPICRDVANLKKHRVFHRSGKIQPNDPNIKIDIIGPAIFNVPQRDLSTASNVSQTIHLKQEDAIHMGRVIVTYREYGYDARGIVECCMHFWKTFFEENKLLMPRIS